MNQDLSDAKAAYLSEHYGWLIRLRWIAIGGIVVAIVIGWAIQAIAEPAPLGVITAFMVLYNFIFSRLITDRSRATAKQVERRIFIQIILDIHVLLLLLHYSGGIENPFAFFLFFHMAIAGMLMEKRMAFLVSTVTTLSYSAMVLGEYAGLIRHYHLWGVHHSRDGARIDQSIPYHLWGVPPSMREIIIDQPIPFLGILGILVALAMTTTGITYFVLRITSRYRRMEQLQRQAQEIAASRERLALLGELSAGVVHSLRNPLQGVLNCVSTLQGKLPKDDPLQETLLLEEEGLNRIDKIAQRLLILARDTPLHKTPTDINALVKEAEMFMRQPAEKAGIRIRLALDPALPLVMVDRDGFSEVLLSILSNALDACRQGDEICVTTGNNRANPGCAYLEVQDTGCGIPESVLSRITDPFFTTKPTGQGTGLGLAIVKSLIREHQGELKIKSSEGQGTTVTLELPMVIERENRFP